MRRSTPRSTTDPPDTARDNRGQICRARETDILNADQWVPINLAHSVARLARETGRGGVVLVGVDGRSRSGKTTLAETVAAAHGNAAVIHTDDIAWHHSYFDWAEVLTAAILEPLRRHGAPLEFTPQPWIDRGRTGAIHVPAGTTLVLVEGVGATRAALASWYDARIWIDTDAELAMRRTIELDRDPPGFVEDWMSAERAFLDDDRPWERADAIVSGAHAAGVRGEAQARFPDRAHRFAVRALLFDNDGVLVDSHDAAATTWNAWASTWCPGFDFHRDVEHGRRLADVVAGLVPLEYATAATQALVDAEMTSATTVPAIVGAADLLASIPSPAMWAVVTSGLRDMALARLASAGLARPRDVISAEDVKHGKPSPEPYLVGARRLGQPAAACAVFEDAPLGVDAARAAGAGVVIGVGRHTIGLDVDVSVATLAGITFDGHTLTVPVHSAFRVECA